MFQHIGKISGVIGVSVIHFADPAELAAGRNRLTMGSAMEQQTRTEDGGRLLVGDIGGTHARFAIATVAKGEAALDFVEVKASEKFSRLEDAILDYAKDKKLPGRACLAVAGPVSNGRGRMTNLDWLLDAEALARECGFSRVTLVNDFAALAFAITRLNKTERETIKTGTARPDGPISVMGAGTGFGVALLVPDLNGYRLVSTEGGHAAFAPSDESEARIWKKLRQTHEHVSIETLLSGNGLSALHEILTALDGRDEKRTPEEIAQRAAEDECSSSAKTLGLFFDILGSVAGDIALLHGATGGVYLAGGVVSKNEVWLKRSRFAERFSAKGVMSPYVADIPVYLVESQYAALRGAALWGAKQNRAA